MNDSMNLKDALLRQDKWTPEQRTTYQKELTKMIKKPLTKTTKFMTIAGLVLGIVVGMILIQLFLQETLPMLTAFAFAIMAIGSFNMSLYCFSILRQGGKSRIKHGLWHSLHLTVITTLIMCLAVIKVMQMQFPTTLHLIVMIASIFQWIVLGIVPLINWKLQMIKLSNKQKELQSQIEAGQA